MSISLGMKMVVLSAVLALASCGGGTGAPTQTSSGDVGTPRLLTVVTTPGNIVSIGDTGGTFKTVGATGQVEFASLVGKVDVHVFSIDGNASSYYGVAGNRVVDYWSSRQLGSNSSVDVAVSLVNGDIYGQRLLLQHQDGLCVGSLNLSLASLACNAPVGSVVGGTLWISQGSGFSSSGNIIDGFHASEVANLGPVSFTTTAYGMATSVQQSFTATFSGLNPQAPFLARIESIMPPSGLSLYSVTLGDAKVYPTGFSGQVALPDDIYTMNITGGYGWSATGVLASGSSVWSKGGSFALGESIVKKATLVSFPAAQTGQTGDYISWSNASGGIVVNQVVVHPAGSFISHTIREAKIPKTWSILTAGNISSIKLPSLPPGVNLFFSPQVSYKVDISNIKIPQSYEQFISSKRTGFFDYEEVSIHNVLH